MYSSYLRFKKFISALTIALFAVVNPLLSFVPAAYASEGDGTDSSVSTPVDAPADQPSDTATPSDAPAPSDTPAPSDSPAPTDTPAVSDTIPSVDPTPAPDVTPVPATSSDPVNTDDGLWQMLPNGKALTRDAVNMSTTYVAPQNSKVTVHFTQLPDTAGNLTIQEIKLSADQQKQLGALSDTAYDISSNMENGTFKYDLTLPNPAGNTNATVKYSEDVANLDNAQVVTQKKSVDTEEDTITITGLNHFTVFATVLSSTAQVGGSNTFTTLPNFSVMHETSKGQIKVKTFDINLSPSGFVFDTTSNITALVTPATCGGGPNHPVQLASSTFLPKSSTQIEFVVTSQSGNAAGCASTITLSGVKVKPTATTPLASVTLSLANVVADLGGATFDGFNGAGNTVDEIGGDTTAPAIPTIVSPASGSVIKSSAATLDWSDSTDPSSPVTYQYQSSLSNAVGANNGFTSVIYNETNKLVSSEDATATSEGVYYWQVRACDSVGNCSNWSGPWKVTIDNTAPVIVSPSNVTAEATSASGATVTYTSPATSDNVDAAGTASCLPASGTLFAFGNTLVTCNATDVAGNAATPKTFTVTVHDTTIPVITLVGSNPATVELGGTYTDAGATASDNIDGNITANIVKTGSVNTAVVGSYTLYYNVSDAHGNPATQVTRTVNVVDTTKPNVPSLVSPANGAVIKPAAATLDWTDVTDLSNPVTYQYQSSFSNSVGANNGFTSPIYTSGTLTESQIDATGSADGVYYWQARACDALNNCSDWSNPRQVTIDGTAPVTTDSGTDANWHNSNVTVNLSCTDNLSGCDVIYWNTDGTNPTAASHEGTGSSVVVSTTGIHTIKYFAVDQAGNEEAVKTAANTVKIDKVTPGIPLIAGIVSPTNNPIVSWTWGAVTDADSGLQHYQYMLRDAASTIIDSGFTTLTNYSHTFSVDGVYTFFLRAIDNAGNKGTGATSSVTLDVTAPDNPSADHVGGNYASPVTVALTSNDPTVNGVSSNPTTIHYTTDGTNPDASSTLYAGSITINQDTTLKAIAYDTVGNASGVMTEVYYVAPVISDVSSSANSNPASERVIHWTTNINSDSRVVFGTTSVSDTDATTAGSPSYGYSQSSDHLDISPNGVVTHTVTITGLNSFTTYFYRVISAETLATLSAESSFGTEATQGNPGPNGDSSGSGSSSGSSSTTGKVLGATTKAPTPTPVVISGTSVDLESTNPAAGKGSNGSGSGTGSPEASASPSPSVSPSPEASPEMSPQASPTPQSENGKAFQWSWWWLLLLAIIAGGIWYWRRRNNDTDTPA